MSINTLALINYLAWFPALVGAVYFHRFSRAVKSLVILFIIGSINEVLLTVFAHIFHNNIPLVYLYTIVECWLVMAFIYRVNNSPSKVPFIEIILSSVTLTELSVHPLVFGSASRIIMTFTFLYFLGLTVWKVSQGREIEINEYYLIGILLLYYTVSVVYFAFAAMVEGELLLFLTTIHIIINGFVNISFSVILWKSIKSSSLA